jgi:hypothetical protein
MVNINNIFKVFCHSELQEFETLRDFQFLSASGGSPHLLCQMPFRMGEHSKTTSSSYLPAL